MPGYASFVFTTVSYRDLNTYFQEQGHGDARDIAIQDFLTLLSENIIFKKLETQIQVLPKLIN